jgi:hypothetical protein
VWASLPGAAGSVRKDAAPSTPQLTSRRWLTAAAASALAIGLAGAGYVYWGLPYVHGAHVVWGAPSFPWVDLRWEPLSHQEVLARQWVKKW